MNHDLAPTDLTSNDVQNMISEHPSIVKFRLNEAFLAKYRGKEPLWGFGGLSKLVFQTRYCRRKGDGSVETPFEVFVRVVEGVYSIQKRHIMRYGLGWDDEKAQRSAQEMFERMWSFKFTPPGRGFWAMGSALTEERGTFASLFNCSFVSTEGMKEEDPSKPFRFLMDMLMLGVGVGFDTKGAGSLQVMRPEGEVEEYVIPDSREGWVQSLGLLINSYFGLCNPVRFDYSEIRPAGVPIKGFGGVSSGPGPLRELHRDVREILNTYASSQKYVDSRLITDVMNLIGRCVVAGNIRRSAEVSIGDPEDEAFLDLKNYDKNPERAEYGWASNNSIYAELGMDYSPAAERTAANGEPGYTWLENMQAFGRMKEAPDYADSRVKGANPCVEISLESYEMCNLSETYPANHETLEDYKRTLKFAYLYSKTVTLTQTDWAETNRVMLRNRRIGTSVTGTAQFIAKRSVGELKKWLNEGYDTIQYYDDVYSEWLAVPRSVKVSAVKPSGTVSLVAGATPGMHWPQANTYIRRVRLAKNSPYVERVKAAGYPVEDDQYDPSSVVVEFPVKMDERLRTVSEVSMWEQLSMAALLQREWADNQVSATISFQEDEADQIEHALNYFQYQLKGVSFLPYSNDTYPQMPYETIDDDEYERRAAEVSEIDTEGIVLDQQVGNQDFCDSDKCEIPVSEDE